MKEVLTNDKFLAIVSITIISCWAMHAMDLAAKDIIIPAITGICGFVSGGREKKVAPVEPVIELTQEVPK